MREPPADVWVQWPPPNYYHNPKTQGPAIIIVNVIFSVLVLIAFAGRFYSRIVIRKWLGVDDVMCILALIFTIATTVIVIMANEVCGWNRHIWDIPWDWFQTANIIAFVAKLTFTLAATFIRLSLICFYYRLIKDSGIKWFNLVLHLSVAWTLSVCIVFIILTIWLCSPIKAYWVWPIIEGSKCLDEGKVVLGGGVVNSVSDLLTTVLPIPIVWRLQMPLRQRIGVCILLCLGFLATISGSIRTYYTWKSLIDSYDETWFAYPLWIAAAVELDLGLICSCAPAWKTLLAKPLKELSSKLSSLRSPSTSPDSSAAAKPSVFNPLRSLPWFQITRLEFERTQREPDEIALQDLERGSNGSTNRMSHEASGELPGDEGVRDFRFSDIIDERARPSTPGLQINMRQSIDQSSSHHNDSLVPGEWFSDGAPARSSPRRVDAL